MANGQDLPRAYAIVTGRTPAEMAGTEFLIDGDGWLRAMQGPTAAPAWNDPKRLASDIRQYAAHPIGATHAHMQM